MRSQSAVLTAALALLGVTLIWGTTFPLLKSLSGDLNGFEVCFLRFVLATLLLLPWLLRAPRRTWHDGAQLAALNTLSYVAQAWGLHYITSNRSAVLTSLNVLMTPLLGVLLGARATVAVFGAAVSACAGIALMSWEGGSNLAGDSATILCALAYTVYVVKLSACSARHDTRRLTATQIALMALFSGMALAAQPEEWPQAATLLPRALAHAGNLVYLGCVATAAMLFLQAWAQRVISADKAAVIYAMEPVFATLFGWWWLGETLGWRGVLGGLMVVLAVIVSERYGAVPQEA